MVARVAGRSGHRYRTARAYVLAASDTCWICGHPGSRQIDHDPALVVLLEMGVDPDQPRYMKPAHGIGNRCPICRRRCNQERGIGPPPVPLSSRQW